MAIFASFNVDGSPASFWDEALYTRVPVGNPPEPGTPGTRPTQINPAIPSGVVEVTDADRAAFIASPGAYRWQTGARVVAPPPPLTADSVSAEFDRRIAALVRDKRSSILSYAIKLNGLVSIGIAKGLGLDKSLTADQQSDVAIIWAIDDWESAMIDKRQALIAALLPDAATLSADATWPAPPAGVTDAWLNGF